MILKDIMSDSVVLVHPDETLQEAAKKMKESDVGALPVYDGTHTVGIITDRDIVIRAVAAKTDLSEAFVKNYMTSEVIACPSGYDIAEAAQIMEHQKIRRLVVVDANYQPVGVVSLKDLAQTRNKDLSCDVLKGVTKDNGLRNVI